MPERATPLAQRVPVVEPDRTPTPYFQRQFEALLREVKDLRARVETLEGSP
jgi:hypothetical protein